MGVGLSLQRFDPVGGLFLFLEASNSSNFQLLLLFLLRNQRCTLFLGFFNKNVIYALAHYQNVLTDNGFSFKIYKTFPQFLEYTKMGGVKIV
jgi:hypothetical protein